MFTDIDHEVFLRVPFNASELASCINRKLVDSHITIDEIDIKNKPLSKAFS